VRLAAAVMLLAFALSGCETSQEKSAQLEKAAKHVIGSAAKGLTIAKTSTAVRVLATQVLHDSEGTAAVVTLRNLSAHALADVPIAITVHDASGGVLYKNNTPGLEAALTTVPLLAPGARFTWIDDQVQVTEGAAGNAPDSSPSASPGSPASTSAGTPTSVTAQLGEAPAATGPVPQIRATGVHATEAPEAGVAGSVANDSSIAQHGLVVYGLARRGTRIVAAGRAVLSEVPAHGSLPFQVLFIGSTQGAHVEASAPPTTF
jgi:hypothetical protein